jgi:hypothetical protein
LAAKKSDPSELKIALDNRSFEIQLFWQRSNYFLVLITALGIGTFSIKDEIFAALAAVFATISSFLWFRTNLGSRFWQESWEAEVEILAKEEKIRSFERPASEIRNQVISSLSAGGKRSVLRRWVDRQIIKKPSVTSQMIYLSLTSSAVWFAVAVILISRIVYKLYVENFSIADLTIIV